VPIDRDATLKQAEKLLRQGKLEAAIQEYVRLVDDQPRDWNAINALGDLYVRAGDADRAVAQFTRIADHLYGEGFYPKAAALYKKALKVRADHEPTILQLADIAARQGLFADARMYLRQLAEQRRARGDRQGAAECLVRMGMLDDADGETKVAAAQAAQAIGSVAQAVVLFGDAATAFEKQRRPEQALDALIEAARLDPANAETRGRIVQACVAAGQVDRAAEFLTPESAGEDPDLLLALAQIELARGADADARGRLMRVLMIAPDRGAAIVDLAGAFAARGDLDVAYGCIEVAVDAALFEADFARAATLLETFVGSGAHVGALMKLVEVCVDAGFDDRLRTAQAQLADAYLDAGRAAEARVIAEDLFAGDRESAAHRARLRRALEALGVDDPDEEMDRLIAPGLGEPLDLGLDDAVVAAEVTAAPVPAAAVAPVPETEVDLDIPLEPVVATPVVAPPEPVRATPERSSRAVPAGDDEPIVLDALEIDLSATLATLHASSPVLPPSPPNPDDEPVQAPRDLESVFEEMRQRAARDPRTATRDDGVYERAQAHLAAGRWLEAVHDLEAAARTPALRFLAASQLGRLHIARGELSTGTEWLERAAEAPAPTTDDATAVLYDLATALEKMGEGARALAIFMEIQVDAGAYRDVGERVERLARVQAGSHGA
jgi:tetratricopeptide (TPR) repeat protein